MLNTVFVLGILMSVPVTLPGLAVQPTLGLSSTCHFGLIGHRLI